jgi:hypothetical protein
MKRLLTIASIGLIAAFTGCGEDAPEGQRDRGPADIINFPDGFGNVAHKCDGRGHRIYSAGASDAGTAIAVLPDETCRGNVP